MPQITLDSSDSLSNALMSIYNEEKEKLIESIEQKCKEQNPSGIEQTIGRRLGFFFEEALKKIFEGHKGFGDAIFFRDFIQKFTNDFISRENVPGICKPPLAKIVEDFAEVSGTKKQDLCDFTLYTTQGTYAIDTKWRFRSGDSKTVRQIGRSALQLKHLGFIPLLIIRRPRSECLEQSIRRFETEGWKLYFFDGAMKFVKKESNFDFEQWIEDNVDFWGELKTFHQCLKGFRKNEKNFEF